MQQQPHRFPMARSGERNRSMHSIATGFNFLLSVINIPSDSQTVQVWVWRELSSSTSSPDPFFSCQLPVLDIDFIYFSCIAEVQTCLQSCFYLSWLSHWFAPSFVVRSEVLTVVFGQKSKDYKFKMRQVLSSKQSTTHSSIMTRHRIRQQRQRRLRLAVPLWLAISLCGLLRAVSFALAKEQPKQQQLRGSFVGRPVGRNLTSSRIVGGRPVYQPYPFFIEWTGCGGSLITEDMMLTAAHCDRGEHSLRRRVHLGGRMRQEGVVARNMVKRIPHPLWDASLSVENNIEWDFLVVKLNETTAGMEGVEPILLLNQDPNYPVGGETLTAMGFGKTYHSARDAPSILRHVDIKAFSNEECEENYGSTRVRFQRESMLCAGVYEGGKATCQGKVMLLLACVTWRAVSSRGFYLPLPMVCFKCR